ncbi:MAG: LysR family transcriptional regulator [Proteobacteria bacterium]|nr:LysR family transcriptional regulator [Pseudomonadota bacterium]
MHQIRYFLAVSKSLNFTRAAEECHVVQPSLSRAIRKLEEELGGDLFRRERSQTHLTDLGRKMQPLLRQACGAGERAGRQIPINGIVPVTGRIIQNLPAGSDHAFPC